MLLNQVTTGLELEKKKNVKQIWYLHVSYYLTVTGKSVTTEWDQYSTTCDLEDCLEIQQSCMGAIERMAALKLGAPWNKTIQLLKSW